MSKVKIKVMYGKLFNSEWQDKTFKDVDTAIAWCQKNYDKISCINDYRTFYQWTDPVEIFRAIKGVER